MPYIYIGRNTWFKGKTLWEIIGNLKNFGVGRILTRGIYERYPEPTYFKIIQVEPLPNPINPSMDDRRKVKVIIERTFRGKTYPYFSTIISTSYKDDYRLLPKDEEEAFCNRSNVKSKLDNVKIFPKYMDFPPLLKEALLREMKEKNEDPNNLKLKVLYRSTMRHKIAEDGETPTVEITMGLGKPKHDILYKGIKL